MEADAIWPHSIFKRALDILGSLFLLILLWPVMLVLALGVFLSVGRPLFFRQKRPGKKGLPFLLVKFRTLRGSEADTETPGGKIPPTPFAKGLRASGLDEVPELWNILKGDMSFVGPRPLLMRYLDRYTDEQNRRHNIRPGLTGLAQVKGRNAIDWEARLDWDVSYVEKATFKTDSMILWQTLSLLGRGEGTGEPGEFRGTADENR